MNNLADEFISGAPSNENSPPTAIDGSAATADAPAPIRSTVGQTEPPGAGALRIEPAPPFHWHNMELPSEDDLAELLYKFNVVEEGPEYIDGHPIDGLTKAQELSWSDAIECGYDTMFRAAAAEMLKVLRAAQDRIRFPKAMDTAADVTAADLGLNAEPELEPNLPEGFDWAICELMGHVRHVGRTREEEKFGHKLCRVDVPKIESGKIVSWTTLWFGGASIYRFTLTDEATVIKANTPYESPGRYRSLPAPDDPADSIDDDESF
jgi:hypothetical protein